MVDLIATSPLAGLLPQKAGQMTLSEASPAYITSISPFKGKDKPCTTALKAAHELALPGVGWSVRKGGLAVMWTGRGEYFLAGEKPAGRALAKTAALTDQSDSWAVMRLEGDNAEAVMARICPLDLRTTTLKRGHVARTEVAHMMAIVARLPKGFEIWVMRSFGKTAVDHVVEAMEGVVGQSAIQ